MVLILLTFNSNNMKKLFFLSVFVLCAGLVSAQDTSNSAKKSCSKTCAKTCASKTASASADSETKVASAEKAAEIAAAQDENIEKKVCSVTGNVSYYMKSTCEHSGAVKMTEVKFDEESESFVSLDKTSVMSAEKQADVEKKSKAKTCSKEGTKSCCASKKKGA